MFRIPNKEAMNEPQKRWLSWQFVTARGIRNFGTKGSYTGTANAREVDRRHAKNRVAKVSRRKNHG